MSDGMTEMYKEMGDERVKVLSANLSWKTGVAEGNYTPDECTLGDEGGYEEDLDVTQPTHYMLFDDLEVIEAIELLLTRSEYRGYCKGNILKYRLRAGKKDDALKDLGKAKQYEAMLKEVE